MAGFPEWILVIIVVVLVFGATRLPQLGDGLGRAIKNFKRAVQGTNEIEVTPKKPDSEEPAVTDKSQAGKSGEKAG
jgi:sec-independent protein translocase protein TatA